MERRLIYKSDILGFKVYLQKVIKNNIDIYLVSFIDKNIEAHLNAIDCISLLLHAGNPNFAPVTYEDSMGQPANNGTSIVLLRRDMPNQVIRISMSEYNGIVNKIKQETNWGNRFAWNN